MNELKAHTPLDGLLPLQIGDVELTEAPQTLMTLIAPFQGQAAAVSELLKKRLRVKLPKPNRRSPEKEWAVQWFGFGSYMLIGTKPPSRLKGMAALTDQSDAWATAILRGDGARDVLARLTPLDLRPHVFKVRHTARSELRHMPAAIARLKKRRYAVMVYRSFADTMVHELRVAMESVAAGR